MKVGCLVSVRIGGVVLVGTVAAFPSRKVEYRSRPVIVRIADAEYVTVDMSAVTEEVE